VIVISTSCYANRTLDFVIKRATGGSGAVHPNMAAPTKAAFGQKTLANPEPSTHDPKLTWGWIQNNSDPPQGRISPLRSESMRSLDPAAGTHIMPYSSFSNSRSLAVPAVGFCAVISLDPGRHSIEGRFPDADDRLPRGSAEPPVEGCWPR